MAPAPTPSHVQAGPLTARPRRAIFPRLGRLPVLMLPLLLTAALTHCNCRKKGQKPLLCYVGKPMVPAMEEIAQEYVERTDQAVTIQAADQTALLEMIDQTRQGDLCVCHDPFADALEAKDLEAHRWAVARLADAAAQAAHPLDPTCVKVTISTLTCSKQEEAAAEFARFVDSPQGRAIFRKHGFAKSPEATSFVGEDAGSLYLYCGAGLRTPVEEAINVFMAKHGVAIQADFRGSGILLSALRTRKTGDLYLPGDIRYVATAYDLGLVRSHDTICYFIPVILVQKGNPKGIQGVADLAKAGLKLGFGDPDATAIGQATVEIIFKIFKTEADRDPIYRNQKDSALTVNELGPAVQTGNLDAAIVWDATAAQYAKGTDIVRIPANHNVISHVAVAVLASSTKSSVAEKFAKFLASDRGKWIFRKHHFTTTKPKD